MSTKGTLTLSSGKTNSNGDISLTIAAQPGNTVLSVYITDSAGRSVYANTIVIDTTPPHAPYVYPVHPTSTSVTGTAEINTTITITTSGGQTYTGSVDKYGRFSILIAKQTLGTKLTVTATDAAGNVSLPTIVTVS